MQLASNCIHNSCEFYLRSFWVWADTRLALIAAVVQNSGDDFGKETVELENAAPEATSQSLPNICLMIQQSIFKADEEGRISRYGTYLDMIEPVPYSSTDEWDMFSSGLARRQSYCMPPAIMKAVLNSLQARTV